MRLFLNGDESAEREDLLRGIRELQVTVTYQGTDGYYLLTDESRNELLTEDLDYIGTEKEHIIIKEDSILSVRYYCKSGYIKTMCKMIELNTKLNIPIGTEIMVKLGVKNKNKFSQKYGEYFFAKLGKYYIYDSEYDPDTDSYILTAYDKMYESMIKYDGDINVTFPCTPKEFLTAIFDKFNWDYSTFQANESHYVFDDLDINSADNCYLDSDIYLGKDMTYRDVIDDLSVMYGCLGFSVDNVLVSYNFKYTEEGIVINYEDLKQNNIKITNPNNSQQTIQKIILTNSENLVYTLYDNTQVVDGKTFDIGNNLIVQLFLNDWRYEDLIKDDIAFLLATQLLGDESELNTIGIITPEALDWVSLYDTEGNWVKDLMIFEDEIKINKGLEETILNSTQYEEVNNYTSKSNTNTNINSLESGTCNLNGDISTINFKSSFSKVPSVTITIYSNSAPSSTIVPRITNITTDSFSAVIDGLNSGSVSCCWIAISL